MIAIARLRIEQGIVHRIPPLRRRRNAQVVGEAAQIGLQRQRLVIGGGCAGGHLLGQLAYPRRQRRQRQIERLDPGG